LEDERELVAAEPRHGVTRTRDVFQTDRELLEHSIAGMVAQRVVDVLEAVEVEQHQCEAGAIALR
jgi:hypothetical protein